MSEKINDIRELVENYLSDKPLMDDDILQKAMNYSLTAGGKRIRPVLFLLMISLYNKDIKDYLPFAAGIEMIHTYSLIHDDLPAMDNDDYRRGKPTCHKQFNEATAILAGDGLLTEAFSAMLSLRGVADSDKLLRAVGVMADKAGLHGMVYGQSLDIGGENKSLSLEELLKIHKNKTGALITAALLCGAILGGANEAELKAVEQYGNGLGLAFQITDDILDKVGSFEDIGKPVGSDMEQNKTTYVTLIGVEGAYKKAQEATDEAIAAINCLQCKDISIFEDLAKSLLARKR